jgi:hypothetical protein
MMTVLAVTVETGIAPNFHSVSRPKPVKLTNPPRPVAPSPI